MPSARALCAALGVAVCIAAAIQAPRNAQAQHRKLVIKNGESIELHTVYWVANCRSIMVGLPTVEVLDGPPEVKVSVREGMVVPRTQNCAKPVAGGTLVATLQGLAAPKEAKLTYRVMYKTRDGERPIGRSYELSLFP